MAQVKVAEISQVPPGTGKAVQAGTKQVALFNVGGTFYALDSLCTHRHGPLAEGTLEGTIVTCPWHGSKFDVRSGHVVKGPAILPVTAYPVKVEGTDVLLEIG
jgi:nitrite reductase/ring-hydroxylating ferredoxin subunit